MTSGCRFKKNMHDTSKWPRNFRMSENTIAANRSRCLLAAEEPVWLFGYGSLIFKGRLFPYLDRRPASIDHWGEAILAGLPRSSRNTVGARPGGHPDPGEGRRCARASLILLRWRFSITSISAKKTGI